MATLMKAWVILLVYLASGRHDTLARCKPRKDTCPSAWTLWDGNCYKATPDELDWFGARAQCEGIIGGKMATPKSLQESLFMGTLALNVWINCNDIQQEGTWNCTDGVTEIPYRNWFDNEPNNDGEGEDCVFMPNDKGNWLDVPCDGPLKTVCKQPIQP
ncbi:C-type lectin domain family 4 member M-like [Asterias rubens]|uniref:C-type lectin domain family 4 member M-like n=1 Tax=Asterias rubens TaxID=7604 RepID=UPI001455715A|nr:C-type lectin domain family 4 member M-like [Asterias rubens]